MAYAFIELRTLVRLASGETDCDLLDQGLPRYGLRRRGPHPRCRSGADSVDRPAGDSRSRAGHRSFAALWSRGTACWWRGAGHYRDRPRQAPDSAQGRPALRARLTSRVSLDASASWPGEPVPDTGFATWPHRSTAGMRCSSFPRARTSPGRGAYLRSPTPRQRPHPRGLCALRQSHTLPPHTAGAAAALAGGPSANVLVLAHNAFCPDGRARPWWRLPIHRQLLVRTALFSAAEASTALFSGTMAATATWTEVDTWVADHADPRGANKPDLAL